MARAAATAIPKSFFCIRFSFVCMYSETWPQLVKVTRPAPLERSWTECAKPPASAQQERGFGDANAGHVLWLCNRPERRTQFRSDLCAAAISPRGVRNQKIGNVYVFRGGKENETQCARGRSRVRARPAGRI